jgi:hypothetical protein
MRKESSGATVLLQQEGLAFGGADSQHLTQGGGDCYLSERGPRAATMGWPSLREHGRQLRQAGHRSLQHIFVI